MKMSSQQAHVLANLNRVGPLHYLQGASGKRPRYQLDGRECTPQVTGLVVRKLVEKLPSGRLERIENSATRESGAFDAPLSGRAR